MKTLALVLALTLPAAGVAVAQTPPAATAPANPATEPLLRATIEGIRSGTVDYETMTPTLADSVRSQAGPMKNLLERFGAVQTVEHAGGENGEDVFLVRFAGQATRWTIAINAEGRISKLVFRPA